METRHVSTVAEVLEARRLLSSASVLHGVLTIRADAGLPNTITVDVSADNQSVDVSVSSVSHRGVAKTLTKEFPRFSINSIRIFGSSKADTILVGQVDNGNTLDILTRIDAGAGNDTITTDSENDLINAGSGNDTINSGPGNDTIHGEAGNDTITPSGGNAKIDGGAGNDTVTTGDGNDTIRGGSGKDLITVGNGSNLVFGEAGDDVITAGDGNDTIWGGAGNDDIHGGDGSDTFGGVLGKNTLIGGNGRDTFVVRKTNLTGQTTNYSADKGDVIVEFPKETNPPKF